MLTGIILVENKNQYKIFLALFGVKLKYNKNKEGQNFIRTK